MADCYQPNERASSRSVSSNLGRSADVSEPPPTLKRSDSRTSSPSTWVARQRNVPWSRMAGFRLILLIMSMAMFVVSHQVSGFDIVEVGSGGGSVAWLDSQKRLHVGPQSAGSTPGPVSYGRAGTEPTVTDANLVLGRLNAERFLGGELKLDANAARRSIEQRVAEPLGYVGPEEMIRDSGRDYFYCHSDHGGRDPPYFRRAWPRSA